MGYTSTCPVQSITSQGSLAVPCWSIKIRRKAESNGLFPFFPSCSFSKGGKILKYIHVCICMYIYLYFKRSNATAWAPEASSCGSLEILQAAIPHALQVLLMENIAAFPGAFTG